MKTVFEIISQDLLPSLRSMIAKQLMENGFSQKQVADRLGVSQPAVSQYKRDLRGQRSGIFVDHPQLLEESGAIAKRVASGELSMDDATLEMFTVSRTILEK